MCLGLLRWSETRKVLRVRQVDVKKVEPQPNMENSMQISTQHPHLIPCIESRRSGRSSSFHRYTVQELVQWQVLTIALCNMLFKYAAMEAIDSQGCPHLI
jgi:hypothetical protein